MWPEALVIAWLRACIGAHRRGRRHTPTLGLWDQCDLCEQKHWPSSATHQPSGRRERTGSAHLTCAHMTGSGRGPLVIYLCTHLPFTLAFTEQK